jgi:hypothetical protein
MDRILGQNLNNTLLESGLLGDAGTVLVHDAPGIAVQFSQPDGNDFFDVSSDCEIYSSEYSTNSLVDGIQICIKASGSSLVIGKCNSIRNVLSCTYWLIGWTPCPTIVYLAPSPQQNCSIPGIWSQSVYLSTILTTNWEVGTVAYSGQNLTILNVDIASSATKPYIIDPSNYRAVWSKLFTRDNATSPEDTFMMQSVMFQLGWYLRLYQDRFTDDQKNPLALLQNFISIPLLFTVTALQWANATCELDPRQQGCTDFSMPDNLRTTASPATIDPRFLGEPWPVALFMGIGSLVLLWHGAILALIILHPSPLRHVPSDFPDKDTISPIGSGTKPVNIIIQEGRLTLNEIPPEIDQTLLEQRV